MAVCDLIESDEVWYPLPLWPGYEFSSDMRLRAHRVPGGPRTSGPRNTWVSVNGYPMCSLRRNGRRHDVYIHRLVAELAYGSIPDGDKVLHRDDNKLVNYPSNLGFGDSQTNADDCFRNGTFVFGDVCPWAKLTDEDVREIRRLIAKGEKHGPIAARYGVNPCVISEIKIGRKWKRVV